MRKFSRTYIFIFILITTLTASAIVTITSISLQSRQAKNQRLDKKKNVLVALRLISENSSPTNSKIDSIYENNIREIAVNPQGTRVDPPQGQSLLTINPEKKDQKIMPVFIKEQAGEIEAYCFPVAGKGLWSSIYGYLALERDLNTVLGITFYKHGETPGLGAEVEKQWFTSNFIGKKVFNENNELVSIEVVKGKIKDEAKNITHKVDGITGATKTGDGVTQFLHEDLNRYKPFIKNTRNQSGGK